MITLLKYKMVLRSFLDINSVLYDNIIYDINNLYLVNYIELCHKTGLLHNYLYKLYKYNSILSEDIVIKNKMNLNKEYMSIYDTYTLFKLNSFYFLFDEIKNKMYIQPELFKGKIIYKKDFSIQFFNRKVSASSVLNFYFGGSYGNNLITSKALNISNYFYIFKDSYLSSFLNLKNFLNLKLYFNYLNINYMGYEHIKNLILVLNRLERENSYIFLIKNLIEGHSYFSHNYFGDNLSNLRFINYQYNICNIKLLVNRDVIYINNILDLDISYTNNSIKKYYNIQKLFTGLYKKQTQKIETTEILISLETVINLKKKINYENVLSENYLFMKILNKHIFINNINILFNSKNINTLNINIKNNVIFI